MSGDEVMTVVPIMGAGVRLVAAVAISRIGGCTLGYKELVSAEVAVRSFIKGERELVVSPTYGNWIASTELDGWHEEGESITEWAQRFLGSPPEGYVVASFSFHHG